MLKIKIFRSCIAQLIVLVLLLNFFTCPHAIAEGLFLPVPGTMVRLSLPFDPPMLKGIKIHPDNPLGFDFILDQGIGQLGNEQIKEESAKLVRYFLAGLTIPEKDLWVNLSPYEKDRIIPSSFGLTEMGRDLLAEDYMLKQIAASLIYPEDMIGKKFWKRVYQETLRRFGTSTIPVETFNKVWIIPEKAVIYENAQAGTAYIVESKLKVMLDQDYLAVSKNSPHPNPPRQGEGSNALGSQIVREIILPELEKEINEGRNFAQLRQVYNSLILATWYKKKIKDSILAQVYADKNKTAGVQYTSSVIPAKTGIRNKKDDVEIIYQRYLKAFKKGVYNYIKEEPDPLTQETVPRKYFSGGMDVTHLNLAMTTVQSIPDAAMARSAFIISTDLMPVKLGAGDGAMSAHKNSFIHTHASIDTLGIAFNILREILIGRVRRNGIINFVWVRKRMDGVVTLVGQVTNDQILEALKILEGYDLLMKISPDQWKLIGSMDQVEHFMESKHDFVASSPAASIPEARLDSAMLTRKSRLPKIRAAVESRKFGSQRMSGTELNGLNLGKSERDFTYNFYDNPIKILGQIELIDKGKIVFNGPNVGLNANTRLHVLFFESRPQEAFAVIFNAPIHRHGVDAAMNGGIDLSSANMNLQTKVMDSRFDGEGIKFHLDAAMLLQLKNAPGFMPVIINIQPLKDLLKFLGISESLIPPHSSL